MKAFSKIYKAIVNVEAFIAVVALLSTISLNAVEIFLRYFFDSSLIWIQEISTLLMLWFTLLGLCKVVEAKQDIIVTALVMRMPPKMKRLSSAFVFLACMAFLAICIFYTFKLYINQAGATTIVVHIPLRLRSAAILISFITLFFANLQFLIELIKNKPEGSEE